MDIKFFFSKFYLPFRWWLHPHPRLDNRRIIAGKSACISQLMIFKEVSNYVVNHQICLLSQAWANEWNPIKIHQNDMGAPATPSAVSYDGKLRHVGAAWLKAEVAMSK